MTQRKEGRWIAPLNARRLNIDVPCAKLGRCVDCNSPNWVCRALLIHERKPTQTDVFVTLVGEELRYQIAECEVRNAECGMKFRNPELKKEDLRERNGEGVINSELRTRNSQLYGRGSNDG